MKGDESVVFAAKGEERGEEFAERQAATVAKELGVVLLAEANCSCERLVVLFKLLETAADETSG